jgi:hypothetical protein
MPAHRSAKRVVANGLAAAVIAGVALPAQAQPVPDSPFSHTCADFARAADGEAPGVAEFMLIWLTGYFYGRFEGAESGPFTPDNFATVRDDMINLLGQVCPNRPDITMAEIAVNFSADVERQFGGE